MFLGEFLELQLVAEQVAERLLGVGVGELLAAVGDQLAVHAVQRAGADFQMEV